MDILLFLSTFVQPAVLENTTILRYMYSSSQIYMDELQLYYYSTVRVYTIQPFPDSLTGWVGFVGCTDNPLRTAVHPLSTASRCFFLRIPPEIGVFSAFHSAEC